MNCWRPTLLTLFCLKVFSFSRHSWKVFLLIQISRFMLFFSLLVEVPFPSLVVTVVSNERSTIHELFPCMSFLCTSAAFQIYLLSLVFSCLTTMHFRGGLLHVCLMFNEHLISANVYLHQTFSYLFAR